MNKIKCQKCGKVYTEIPANSTVELRMIFSGGKITSLVECAECKEQKKMEVSKDE